MAEEVFIDASFWIALVNNREAERYRIARVLWNTTIDNRWPRVTTTWTLYEALTFLNRREMARHDLALDLLTLARNTTTIVDAVSFEDDALGIFQSHSDKRWSVVDCASFVCIRERRSNLALSFDYRDFAQAQNEFGFTLLGA